MLSAPLAERDEAAALPDDGCGPENLRISGCGGDRKRLVDSDEAPESLLGSLCEGRIVVGAQERDVNQAADDGTHDWGDPEDPHLRQVVAAGEDRLRE